MTRRRKSVPTTQAERLDALKVEMLETRLRIDRARAQKLEADLPDPDAPVYTSYEDMPPPSPEDRARFLERFKQLYLRASASSAQRSESNPGSDPGLGFDEHPKGDSLHQSIP